MFWTPKKRSLKSAILSLFFRKNKGFSGSKNMLPVGIIKIPFRSVFYGKKVISKKNCFWRAPIAHSARQFENNFIRKKPFFRKQIEISKVRARCAIGARQSILNFYIVYLPCKTRRKGFMVILSESMFFLTFFGPLPKDA